MEKELLRKVQLELLSILSVVDGICKRNNIQYFLDSGTLIGAIRHHGFIPWDDDLDIGMLRSDYEKFNMIAQKELGSSYFWQTWNTEERFALPYGKVRKRNTLYLEAKGSVLKENGFFIDVLPYDFAPNDEKKRIFLKNNQIKIQRQMIMKAGYSPWIVSGKTDLKRRIGYLPYQFLSSFTNKESLIKRYLNLTYNVDDKDYVYEQTGRKYYPFEWMKNVTTVSFEGITFPVIEHYHDWLTVAYGDYMTPPPESERENRHQIYKIEFGND